MWYHGPMRQTLRYALAVVVGACAIGFFPGATASAQEQGFSGPCFGAVDSYNSDGTLIDSAIRADNGQPVNSKGEAAFTQDNPFKIAPGGRVEYSGTAVNANGNPARDHIWILWVQVPQFGDVDIIEGGSANEDGTTDAQGTISLDELEPFRNVGTIKLELFFNFYSEDVQCQAWGVWALIDGSTTVPNVAVAVLGIIGLVALWRARRIVSLVLAGVLVGLAGSVATITNGYTTPSVNAVAIPLAIGAAIGVLLKIPKALSNKNNANLNSHDNKRINPKDTADDSNNKNRLNETHLNTQNDLNDVADNPNSKITLEENDGDVADSTPDSGIDRHDNTPSTGQPHRPKSRSDGLSIDEADDPPLRGKIFDF